MFIRKVTKHILPVITVYQSSSVAINLV